MSTLIDLVFTAEKQARPHTSGITYRHTHAAVVTFPITKHNCPTNRAAVSTLSSLLTQQGIRHRVIAWHVGRMAGRAVYIPQGFFL